MSDHLEPDLPHDYARRIVLDPCVTQRRWFHNPASVVKVIAFALFVGLVIVLGVSRGLGRCP